MVYSLREGGDIRNIVDAWLAGNFDTSSVWKAVETAMECLPPISIQRPTMSHVVIQLKVSGDGSCSWRSFADGEPNDGIKQFNGHEIDTMRHLTGANRAGQVIFSAPLSIRCN